MKYLLVLLSCVVMYAGTIKTKDIESKGNVYVNGKKVKSSTKVNLGDFIKTNKNSRISFKVGENVFMAKENTKLVIEKSNGIKTLNVITGSVLAVFKKGSNFKIKTSNMTAGIRGTGVFIERKADGETYFCNCYGDTDVKSGRESRNLKTHHHGAISIDKSGKISKTGMANHSDDELRSLEKMAHRVPAFDR